MARKGLAKPIGSMTQMDRIRVSREGRTERLAYGDIVPLAPLSDIVFGAWDAYPANALQSALFAEVLSREDIMPVKDELEQIRPMAAAFDRDYARRIDGSNVKPGLTRWQMVEALREDIRNFRARHARGAGGRDEGRRPRAHRSLDVLCLGRIA